VKEAGFDFVEVNFCHGFLPNQFFSAVHNHRTMNMRHPEEANEIRP